LRIEEQETRLALHEHDDDDADDSVLSVRQARFINVGERKARGRRSRWWSSESTNWTNVGWQEIIIVDVD